MPPLRREDLDPDPIAQFGRWYELAVEQVPLADAMTLATVDDSGSPDARMVLLKGHGQDGFRFFTNYESAKAGQLEAAGRAALVVYWRELDRQVRVRGAVERLQAADSDEYFASRAYESQLGAWASPQSAAIGSRDQLDALVDEQRQRLAEGAVPRPEHWGGYLLVPETVELWQGQVGRLHDRFLYSRSGASGDAGAGWAIERLAP